jgi:hypothetical protein
MERTDVQRMADSVLRDYGVPLKVSAISVAEAGWTIAFSGYPGSPLKQVNLRCGERSSVHHVRESLKRSLDVCD